MNKTFVINLKASIAFLAPALAALGAALVPYENNHSVPSAIGWMIIFSAAVGAGIVSLSSFLSRSYADHEDDQPPEKTTPAP